MKASILPRFLVLCALAGCQQQFACPAPVSPDSSGQTVSNTMFRCENGKSFLVHTYLPRDIYVDLELSDGRKLRLYRSAASSGTRYASADEQIEFWNQGGRGAWISEGKTMSYGKCASK